MEMFMLSLLAITLPPFIERNLTLIIPALIVGVGLLIIGLGDVTRFSMRRVWAISGVCFAESIRRKIWLITVIAILGAIAVAQLQNPVDEADAIRQTIKFCLFATGLVLVISTIILACTNLPKEIENRVIFTIVTKPTTRLEIVLGKIIGFARVSALILLLMGAFTWAYVRVRAFSLQKSVTAHLQDKELDPAMATIFTHYKNVGLLQTRELKSTLDFQVYNRVATADSKVRYMGAQADGDLVVPFTLTLADLMSGGDPGNSPLTNGFGIAFKLGFDRNATVAPVATNTKRLPEGIAAPDTPADQLPVPQSAHVQVQILNEYQETLIASNLIRGAQDIELTDPSGQREVVLPVAPDACGDLIRYLSWDQPRTVYVQIAGLTADAEYSVPDDAVKLLVPPDPRSAIKTTREILPPSDRRTGKPTLPIIRGRAGTQGIQVRGGEPGKAPLAVFRYDGTESGKLDSLDQAQFEVRTSIEKTQDDEDDGLSRITRVQFNVLNRSSGELSEDVIVPVESNRVTYFTVPGKFVAGGDFDVQVRSITKGHLCGFFPNSLQLVASRSSFDLNLIKSLLIMWLMSVLVITAAIFCSTFLSWPIAVVLTLLILLGHWGVQQLGDSLQPGVGAAMAQDMGLRDPAANRVVSQSVEGLAKLLNGLAAVLPDISRFAATEDIEKGVSITASRLLEALRVLGIYALPMAVLAYLLLRHKEVAP